MRSWLCHQSIYPSIHQSTNPFIQRSFGDKEMSGNKSAARGMIADKIKESMREALDTVRAHKMRSGLVILGVMIGVASLMGMVATLAGLEKYIAQAISAEDTPYLSLSKIDFFAGEGEKEWEKRKNFTIDDAYALEELPHVRGVYVEYSRGEALKYKDRKAQLVGIVGSNLVMLHIQNMTIAEGSYFTQFELEHRRSVAVMSHESAEALFRDEDPIGKTVRVGRHEYAVVGVFSKRKSLFGGLGENFVVVPYTSYERDFLFYRQDLNLAVIVDGSEYLNEVRESMRSLMRARRRVPLGEPDDFAIITAEATLEFTKKLTDAVALVLVVLSSIGLMVGGIGVMVIMLVSVTERTKEIGIRKAIGATRGEITWQFLVEAATLSGIGGALGIFIGIGLALLASTLLSFPFVLPIGWVIFAVTLSASVGLFFGIFPARKAAKLDPIVALRYE
jgi:putative ABC transport system permease protein